MCLSRYDLTMAKTKSGAKVAETKNSKGVEFIEFPDEHTYFDKGAMQWKVK